MVVVGVIGYTFLKKSDEGNSSKKTKPSNNPQLQLPVLSNGDGQGSLSEDSSEVIHDFLPDGGAVSRGSNSELVPATRSVRMHDSISNISKAADSSDSVVQQKNIRWEPKGPNRYLYEIQRREIEKLMSSLTQS